MEEKLYPPTINGSLPAFYGTEISVPFSMNKTVSWNDISGFCLKIKTVYSNTLLKILYVEKPENQTDKIIFNWQNSDLKIGQFVKVQMAYYTLDNNENKIIGYYSTVGIAKYTVQPALTLIQNNDNFLGTYESSDVTETENLYRFELLNGEELIEDSNWLIHSVDDDIDTYRFKAGLVDTYQVRYSVKTINNIELFDELNEIETLSLEESKLPTDVIVENNFEEGYTELKFILQNDCVFDNIEVIEEDLKKYVESEDLTDEGFIRNLISENYVVYKLGITSENISNFHTEQYVDFRLKHINSIPPLVKYIEIYRVEKTDNYLSQKLLATKKFNDFYEEMKTWSYKDFLVQQGMTYKYFIREWNEGEEEKYELESNFVYSDFEDMFLRDAQGKQLKVRFNPKMSSFKTVRMEQKVDTIGGQFPFIFRNGAVNYKEFPISGLISYKVDNNEQFINHEEDLNIILADNTTRKEGTPLSRKIYKEANPQPNEYTYRPNVYYWSVDGITFKKATELMFEYYFTERFSGLKFYVLNYELEEGGDAIRKKAYETVETLNSTGYNIQAERTFKLKVMDWLGDGKVKFFKSPTEGNYLVRLLNISLTPEDRLGRMLHTFSCTAYEIAECNYENLVKFGFLEAID